MRFGVCAGIDRARLLADLGYDYIELSVVRDLMPEGGEEAWHESRRAIEAMPLRPEAFCILLRDKLVGPEGDLHLLRDYIDTALTRAAQVGGKIVVFGSGGARRVPEGFPREQAERQILAFLDHCADAAERNGVVVVVEPLNQKETNIINSVAEGAEYVRRVNRPGVRNLVDSYHMDMDSEPVSEVVAHADVLAHAHTADTLRVPPGLGSYDHVALFRAFKEADYDERLSIECRWNDLAAEAGPALEHLKKAYAAAQ